MMMKMLEAGGLEIMTDHVRGADEDNPMGYHEYERVKDLDKDIDKSWLTGARGRVLKVISFLIKDLPPGHHYRVVFMRRDLHEILASQSVMLKRRGEKEDTTDMTETVRIHERHLKKVDYQMRNGRHIDFIYIDYREALENPLEAARLVSRFLGGGVDIEKMAGVVDKGLNRQRHDPGTTTCPGA